ncbi:MAG: NHLP bacteriocin system secretion protein [Shimia sp.]
MPRQIVRPPGPEELDRLVRVSRPFDWIAFAVLVACLGAGLVWACIATAPVKVTAQGLLVSAGGVREITGTVEGQVAELVVSVGDRVAPGDTIALLTQPGLADRIARADEDIERLVARRDRIAVFQSEAAAEQARLRASAAAAEDARLADLRDKAERLAQRLADFEALLDRGLTTVLAVNGLRDELADLQAQERQIVERIDRIDVEAVELARAAERELLDLDRRIDEARAVRAQVGAEADRASAIVARVGGRVTELLIRRGDVIGRGAPVARVVPDGGTEDGELVATVFATALDGKKLRPGMTVELVPATARRERDSYMLGDVRRVADLPSSRESLQAALRNAQLVGDISQAGAPYQVDVILRRDPDTVSGFAWANGRGLAAEVEAGTLLQAQAIVDRIPIIALVVPQAETLLEALRSDR